MSTQTSSVHDELQRLQARVTSLEQERRHLMAVIEILEEIGGSLHFVDIVQSIARRLGEAFGLDRCSIFLVERGGQTVRLVASYEDPAIRNYVVDLERYPELRRALQTGQTVFIADAATDPPLRHARGALMNRRVKSITVVPISWKGASIGAIFLRTFRENPGFSDADIQFCQVVAGLTAKALRNAHRFERLQRRQGGPAAESADRERAALIGFVRRLLDAYAEREAQSDDTVLPRASSDELERLVGVAMTVLSQESATP